MSAGEDGPGGEATAAREPGEELSAVVPASLAGERVDRAVAFLAGVPRAAVAELIAAGEVRLNGVVVTVKHRRVVAGELLAVRVGAATASVATPPRPRDLPLEIVYEDEAIAVIDKPAGLVVHPGAGHDDDTLVSGLLARYPHLADAVKGGVGDPMRPGIVHRLDKETSGLLVVALTATAHASLSEQLATHAMGRQYRALALGSVGPDEGVIDAAIGRSERDPTKMAVSVRGRPAVSRYKVLGRFSEPTEATMLEVTLETGRTHQIRVHLAAIGHPVVGDVRYRGARRDVPLGRPFLHAERLTLVHPETGETMTFSSPLAADLAGFLATCR